MSETRCPRCAALVAADAEWCGQCLLPLRERRGDAAVRVRATTSDRVAPRDGAESPAVWRCPTCEAENPLDADRCRTCGTSFARLFDEPTPVSPISPASAAAWSLVLPGLGHWFAGRRADALARFVLTAWVGGTLGLLATSRSGTAGLGSVGALVALFAVAALTLWAEAFVDARRAAGGLPPIVSSRQLLWATVALAGASILLATFIAVSGARPDNTVGPVP